MPFKRNLETILGALSQAPIVYGYVAPDLSVEFHNDLGAEWFGDKTGNFVGEKLSDIVAPEILATTMPRLKLALSGTPVSYHRDFTFYGKPGSSVANYIPQFDELGKVSGIHIFIWDTTEETRSKAEAAIANEMFAKAFNSTAVGMAIVNLSGKFIEVNDALCRMLGYSATELKHFSFHDITHPEDLAEGVERLRGVVEGRDESYTIEKRYIRKDGAIAHGILSVSAVRGPDGAISHYVSQIQDISERHSVEEKLHREHELSRVTLESIGDAVITFDNVGLVTFLNPAAERLTGWALAEARGRHANTVFDVVDAQGRPVESPVLRALETGAVVLLETSCSLKTRTGELIAVEDSAAPIRDANGDVIGAVLVFHDVSVQRAMATRLEYLAHFDAMTGLANRVLFRDRVGVAIASAKSRGEHMAVLFCDLDRFKSVNDLHGHHAGDEVLREVSNRLTAALTADSTICRWAGDEFAILIPHIESANAASELADEIVQACSEPIWIPSTNGSVNIGASVGISIFPEDGVELSELIGAADAALYEAKRAGRNGYRFHQSAFNQQAKDRARRESRLRSAIRDKAFILHYQPRISYTDGRMRGVEALVRMVTDEGLVFPDQFIDLAENNGLMDDLTLIVFRMACRQAVEWRASPHMADAVISINLSPSSLKRANISSELGLILRCHGLDAAQFELEITEGVLIESSDTIRQQILLLHDMGFSISLDDFGTGFSNLGYLRSLPIHKLKIDRSFISAPSFDAEIVKAIIGLGKAMGKIVVAEGVETAHQEIALLDLDCDEGQGFFYGCPVPPEELEDRQYSLPITRPPLRVASAIIG